MIKINLIPEKTEKSYYNSAIRDFIIVGSICYLIFYGIENYTHVYDEEIASLESKITSENAALKRMKQEFEKSKEKRERADEYRKRGNNIKRLGEGRKSPVMMIDNLQRKHPERMWFQSLSFKTSTNTIALEGYALDHTVIAEYLKKLKELGSLDSSDSTELKNFIPQQLLNSGFALKSGNENSEKNDIKTLEEVTLHSLQSEEKDGVTLHKFKITIKFENG